MTVGSCKLLMESMSCNSISFCANSADIKLTVAWGEFPSTSCGQKEGGDVKMDTLTSAFEGLYCVAVVWESYDSVQWI